MNIKRELFSSLLFLFLYILMKIEKPKNTENTQKLKHTEKPKIRIITEKKLSRKRIYGLTTFLSHPLDHRGILEY